jgi:hypothetical protein
MEQTRIFVSSTFFDLAQVREDMARVINDLGHTAIMSEFDSFAVIPSLSTVENCKRNVRNSDLFVLIIGKRRGSLDSTTSKPVTMLEYETAVQAGLDIFVFIDDAILTMLPLWGKNPEADFGQSVESNDVFGFVKQIRNSQQWTFSFKYASEIAATLRTQLSIFFKFLLDKKRGGQLEPLPEFRDETSQAKHILSERGMFWKYELTVELLRPRLIKLKRGLADLEKGLILRPHRTVSGREFSLWIGSKLEEFKSAANLIFAAYSKELPEGFGPAAQQGDPLAILEAVKRIYAGCAALIEWEADVICTHPPEGLEPMRVAMIGSTREVLDEMSTLSDRINTGIQRALEHTSSEPLVVNIELIFKFSRGEKIIETFRQLEGHSDWFA